MGIKSELFQTIVRNQTVILLALKKLLPEEGQYMADMSYKYGKEEYIVGAIDECLKQSEKFTEMVEDE